MSTATDKMWERFKRNMGTLWKEPAASAQAAPENRRDRKLVGSGSLVGAPRRPLKRDIWTRAYVCAIATHWLQHEDATTTSDLMRTAGKQEHILKHADEEDIETLRSAGFLCPNKAV